MSGRSITFNGQTQLRPGGISRISAGALTPVGLTATGIVHLLGEADGGAPGTEGTVVIDDPALAKALFRSGPLADAIGVAFNPSGDVRIPSGAFRVIAYKTNASTQSTAQLQTDVALISDTATGASTATILTVTTAGLVVDAHIGRWVLVNGETRRIVDNSATTITVAPPFSAAPVNTDPVVIRASGLTLASRDYGAHTRSISVELEPGTGQGVVVTLVFENSAERSPEIGGSSFLNIKYVGGTTLATGVATISSSTAVSVNVTGSAPTLNQWANHIMRFSDGTQRRIASNSAADPSATVLDSVYALSTAEQAALTGDTVDIISTTVATVSFTGASGAATALTATATPSDNLSLTFATLGLTTLRHLVDYLNSNTNYEATIPDGVNPDTTLLADFDFGTRNTAVDVRWDHAILPDTKGTFRQDLMSVVNWINDNSELASATRTAVASVEGAELPQYTGGVSGTIRDIPVYFVDGARGISTNSTFQAGFDALIRERGNHIAVLASENLTNEGYGSTATYESVAAQLKEHVRNCRTTGKNEMGGYIGFKGSKTEILVQCAAANDQDVQIVPQQFNFLNVDGTMTLMKEWSGAVAAAGMRSGAIEVGEPLTYKVINTNLITQDSSWSPADRTSVNQLIQYGCLFAETTSTGIIRWVRDMTTHLSDDNIAFMEGNTREAVRFVAYDLRTSLENRFTGVKATPANAASIRDYVIVKMEEYLRDNIIVSSLDPETETTVVPGFRSLRVYLEGNTATIRVEIFPCTGLVWTLNDITLQLPRIVAP